MESSGEVDPFVSQSSIADSEQEEEGEIEMKMDFKKTNFHIVRAVDNIESFQSDSPEISPIQNKEKKIQSPTLKKKKLRKKKKKKKIEDKVEPEAGDGVKTLTKKSVVDEILSKTYWRKKRSKMRKLRKKRMKKLDEEKKLKVIRNEPDIVPLDIEKIRSPPPDEYDGNNVLEGEVKGWNTDEDSVEQLQDKIKSLLDNDSQRREIEDGEDENEGEREEGGGEEDEDDKFWDVGEGIFEEGKEFFDVESRTLELLKENEGSKENNLELLGEEKMDDIIDSEKLSSIEKELNEIFGIKEQIEKVKKVKKKKKRRKLRKKKVYKSILDEILDKDYWKRKEAIKKKKKSRKK